MTEKEKRTLKDGVKNLIGKHKALEHGIIEVLENNILSFIDSLQEEPVSIWHDASERAEKGRLYLYRTNQNIVGINRSEGKAFPDYCERWAYIDDLFKL